VATTTYFDETISDLKADVKINLEFGRSSYYRENLMYFKIDDKLVIVNEETGKQIYEQMKSLAFYLGYER
jgi:hypothetical protein